MEGNYGVQPVYDMNQNANDGWGNGSWIWIIFLFFIMAWGGNGWGGFGNNAATQGALTRADLCQDMNFMQLENSVRGVQNGLCDGFYAQNTTLLNSFGNLQRDLCTGFSTVSRGFDSVNSNINQSRYDMQSCCCETNRNIDSAKYAAERNTCDIVNAIRTDGEATRALINQNTMQDLRDKLEDKDRELLSANFQISQQAQNAYLVNTLQPNPRPAYITCSPYQSQVLAMEAFGNGCNGCGC
jgi:hypothetical protein